ncbi:hypothetical protein [Sphingomonas sp.]|uniref:hypothetical protein n=1 Tax=Sphingomonas sp. TaxID=28214 RepID=UPI00258BE882|nr:hypothetical protein [Sphingomonas sp.]
MSLGRLLRAFALPLLGAMLLVRMGPMCESVGQAAPVAGASSSMADCDREPASPAKKAPPAACAGACVATSVEAHVASPAAIMDSASMVASSHRTLEGRSGGPSPPPPRFA